MERQVRIGCSPRDSAELEGSPRCLAGGATFQKIRQLGFSAYVVMCFLVTIFCMGMMVATTFAKTQGPDHTTFYASTISFILGKFTILVFDKLIQRQTKKQQQQQNLLQFTQSMPNINQNAVLSASQVS